MSNAFKPWRKKKTNRQPMSENNKMFFLQDLKYVMIHLRFISLCFAVTVSVSVKSIQPGVSGEVTV